MTKDKTDLLYLNHILFCIDNIESYLASKTKKHFANDQMMQDAILRNLQIMSESTQKVSKSLKLTVSEVPWHSIFWISQCFGS